MKRSTLLRLLFIFVLAVVVPLISQKPAEGAACYCNTSLECKTCLHTQEPVACVSHHCIWL